MGTRFLFESPKNQGQRLLVRKLDQGVDGGQPDDRLVLEQRDQEGFFGRDRKKAGEPGCLEPAGEKRRMEVLQASLPQGIVKNDFQDVLPPAADRFEEIDEDASQDFSLRLVFEGHLDGSLIVFGRDGSKHILLDTQVHRPKMSIPAPDDEPP